MIEYPYYAQPIVISWYFMKRNPFSDTYIFNEMYDLKVKRIELYKCFFIGM